MNDEPTKYKVRDLPDMKICRAKDMHIPSFADCLVENPYECEHSLRFGYGFFCYHPNRKEIIRNTNNALTQDSDKLMRDDAMG